MSKTKIRINKINKMKNNKDFNLAEEVHHLATSEHSLELELAKELHILSKEIGRMKSMEFIKVFKHPWKFLGFSLLKGIMVGFGSVLGATLFISIFIYILAQISFVPVVGDFVKDVMMRIESGESFTTQYEKAKLEIENEQTADAKLLFNN